MAHGSQSLPFRKVFQVHSVLDPGLDKAQSPRGHHWMEHLCISSILLGIQVRRLLCEPPKEGGKRRIEELLRKKYRVIKSLQLEEFWGQQFILLPLIGFHPRGTLALRVTAVPVGVGVGVWLLLVSGSHLSLQAAWLVEERRRVQCTQCRACSGQPHRTPVRWLEMERNRQTGKGMEGGKGEGMEIASIVVSGREQASVYLSLLCLFFPGAVNSENIFTTFLGWRTVTKNFPSTFFTLRHSQSACSNGSLCNPILWISTLRFRNV